MKKVFFLAMLTLTLATQVACQKEIFDETETLEIFLKEYDYEKLRLIFDDLPEIGFACANYEIANFDGSNKQKLPISQKPLAVYKFSPLLMTPERQKELTSQDDEKNLGIAYFWFIDNNLTKIDFEEHDYVNIYHKDKLIFNEDVGVNALFLTGDKINFLGTGSLTLTSATINNHDLIVKYYPYDHWRRHAGIYLDGKIIFTYLPKEGDTPLNGVNLKIWEDKFLVELISTAGVNKGFLVIDPQTREAIIKEPKTKKL